MSIDCAKCGRQYDVTLFQFGRTINCACGARVGFEHRLNLPKNDEIKFFADVMTARVVRWLRAIGIDTIWEDAIADRDLVRRAIEEKRFILTLDKPLVEEWRVDNVLLLRSEIPLEQFQEIIEHFEIEKPTEFFMRCLVCNTPLRRASGEEILAGAPPDVRGRNQETFDYCPGCNKIYWQGSHTKRMRRAIEETFINAKRKRQNAKWKD
ncbi:MAG: Mut7-C RNAse domain-containing protein [Acidobacteriota bacterium]|nr:Mut7-C RNAse domain-containing protein [Acidobacteriota bacterium]